MAKVGIPADQREAILACTAAVLHLGNVAFAEGRDADSSMVKPGGAAEEALAAAGEAMKRRGRDGVVGRGRGEETRPWVAASG
jgi:hypothetical protein